VVRARWRVRTTPKRILGKRLGGTDKGTRPRRSVTGIAADPERRYSDRGFLPPIRMTTWGLTGGVGAGKSTVAQLLEQRGWSVLDTDLVARRLVEPGQPALREIQSEFGSACLDAEGRLNRGALAGVVFGDPEARKRLEAILHPRIRACWKNTLDQWRHQGRTHGVVVIPLLFEVGAAADFELTVCVGCSLDLQQARLRSRGWTDDQIQQRIAAQWPLRRKLELADRVLWNESSLALLERQLEKIQLR
jgi:dephospho-CoA kinase